jgi:uncharacterized membrane protein YdbT with pleckstrin-like domain
MGQTYLEGLLGDKEEVLLVARQHWLVLLTEIASELLLSIGLLILTIVLAVFIGPWAILILVVLLAPAVSLTRDLLIYMNRMYVITSRRVILLSGVFSKNVTDSSLEKVNDVKLNQSFFGRMLDYGDIEILTASELGVNVIRRIAGPIRYKTAMVNAKAQLESGSDVRPAAKEGDVPALLTQLDALRRQGVLTEEEFQEKKKKLLAKI